MASITDGTFDLSWVKLAQGGDRSAQREIYLHFAPQVLRLARHILQCEATAEEVLQDCFVDVICKISSFKHQGSFAGWLRQIAVNRCLMVLRSSWLKKRSDSKESIEFETDAAEYPLGLDRKTAIELNAALAELPAQTRAVLWLYDVEGYTHVEIGKMMGKTKSFSKSQLARAHEKLKLKLTKQDTTTHKVDQEKQKRFSRNDDTRNKSTPSSANNSLSPKAGGESCTPLLNNY